jgi:exodeoxyribonuclease-1
LLDVVRMTRALRPEGIKWPVDSDGKATNRLELLTGINGLDHTNAHDALNDVQATIALARLLRTKQPKLFDYLLSMRDKTSIKQLVDRNQPFVYSSGKYPGEYEKTTVAIKLGDHPKRGGALVYDLRYDPSLFKTLSANELVKAWRWVKPEERDPNKPRLPIKTLQYNRCPAIAPLAVLDQVSQKRIQIDMTVIRDNLQKLQSIREWPEKILQALDIMDGEQQKRFDLEEKTVDGQIYDGFMSDGDQSVMAQVRGALPDELSALANQCNDQRLKELLPLYKARNFSKHLTSEERQAWEAYKTKQLLSGGPKSKLAQYFARLQQLSEKSFMTQNQRYLLEDLNLYGQSIMPADVDVS